LRASRDALAAAKVRLRSTTVQEAPSCATCQQRTAEKSDTWVLVPAGTLSRRTTHQSAIGDAAGVAGKAAKTAAFSESRSALAAANVRSRPSTIQPAPAPARLSQRTTECSATDLPSRMTVRCSRHHTGGALAAISASRCALAAAKVRSRLTTAQSAPMPARLSQRTTDCSAIVLPASITLRLTTHHTAGASMALAASRAALAAAKDMLRVTTIQSAPTPATSAQDTTECSVMILPACVTSRLIRQ
jgi:hypothetical protein